MTYLVIMVVVALAGILTLWTQQRREHAHLQTADEFRSSLEHISARPDPRVLRLERGGRSVPQSRGGRVRPAGRPAPLDPARREAAKRRLEARRAARMRASR